MSLLFFFFSFYLFCRGAYYVDGSSGSLLFEAGAASITVVFLVCSVDVRVGWSGGIIWFNWLVDVVYLKGVDLLPFLRHTTSIHSFYAESLSWSFPEGAVGSTAGAGRFLGLSLVFWGQCGDKYPCCPHTQQWGCFPSMTTLISQLMLVLMSGKA